MSENLKTKAVAIYLLNNTWPKPVDFHDKKQALLRVMAQKRELSIVGFFALEKTALSIGIKEAIILAQAEKASYLLIDEASSLYLSQIELIKMMEEMLIKGLKLLIAHPNVVFYDHHLQAFLNLMYACRDAHKDFKSSKIKEALKQKKQQGKSLGARNFGELALEKTVTKQIMKLHKEGLTLQKICDLLILNNIATVHNKKWHPSTVKRILDRQKSNSWPMPIKELSDI